VDLSIRCGVVGPSLCEKLSVTAIWMKILVWIFENMPMDRQVFVSFVEVVAVQTNSNRNNQYKLTVTKNITSIASCVLLDLGSRLWWFVLSKAIYKALVSSVKHCIVYLLTLLLRDRLKAEVASICCWVFSRQVEWQVCPRLSPAP